MKVAKQFRWEGAHRLPMHNGNCKNLHGHSYVMTVEIEGMVGKAGMVIDFSEIKKVIMPLVQAWDHATFVSESDIELLQALQNLQSKYFVLPYDSTSENLCQFVIDHFITNFHDFLAGYSITNVRIRVQETHTCYAELEKTIKP